jgi:hypothetical protein
MQRKHSGASLSKSFSLSAETPTAVKKLPLLLVNLGDTGQANAATLWQSCFQDIVSPLLFTLYPGQKAGLCVRSIRLSGLELKGNPHGQIDL